VFNELESSASRWRSGHKGSINITPASKAPKRPPTKSI
jgi:hypothetical protein